MSTMADVRIYLAHTDEPEEEYTLHLGAESTPIDAIHIPTVPPPVPAAPPRTRSWRSSSHACERRNPPFFTSWQQPSNPFCGPYKLSFTPSHLRYLPPALFPARDAIITDNPTPSPTPPSAAMVPIDRMPASSHAFINPPHAMFAVARRHTARPTSLELEPMAVASPSRSIGHGSSASALPAAHLPRRSPHIPYDCTYPAHPDVINAAPPSRHCAVAPASRCVARPPVRCAPRHAKAIAFLSNFDFDDLFPWPRHAAVSSYRASVRFAPCALALLTAITARTVHYTRSLVSGPRTRNVTVRRRVLVVLRRFASQILRWVL
ncbi:hypothetical protein FB451DRAFT_1556949 [Mycena latifolia]|nr:hypothetical protein FB451DRAFT_1556949 [Mycena latifolia]